MKILVICPMKQEHNLFKKALASFGFKKHYYKVVEVGIGKVAAASETAVQLCSDYDLVAVIGFAAATKDCKQGDFMIPSVARYSDCHAPEGLVPSYDKEYELQGCDESKILTADMFADASWVKYNKKKFGSPLVFDMESTAVAQVCEDFEVPCLVMKLISDIPETQNEQDFDEFVNTHQDFTQFVEYLESL